MAVRADAVRKEVRILALFLLAAFALPWAVDANAAAKDLTPRDRGSRRSRDYDGYGTERGRDGSASASGHLWWVWGVRDVVEGAARNLEREIESAADRPRRRRSLERDGATELLDYKPKMPLSTSPIFVLLTGVAGLAVGFHRKGRGWAWPFVGVFVIMGVGDPIVLGWTWPGELLHRRFLFGLGETLGLHTTVHTLVWGAFLVGIAASWRTLRGARTPATRAVAAVGVSLLAYALLNSMTFGRTEGSWAGFAVEAAKALVDGHRRLRSEEVAAASLFLVFTLGFVALAGWGLLAHVFGVMGGRPPTPAVAASGAVKPPSSTVAGAALDAPASTRCAADGAAVLLAMLQLGLGLAASYALGGPFVGGLYGFGIAVLWYVWAMRLLALAGPAIDAVVAGVSVRASRGART